LIYRLCPFTKVTEKLYHKPYESIKSISNQRPRCL